MDSSALRQIFVVAAAATSLSACSEQPPPIAQGLSRHASVVFNERLKSRFPVTADEQQLTSELQREHFSVTEITDPASQYRHLAQYEAHDFVCKDVWTILWSAEAGKITIIEGKTGSICL